MSRASDTITLRWSATDGESSYPSPPARPRRGGPGAPPSSGGPPAGVLHLRAQHLRPAQGVREERGGRPRHRLQQGDGLPAAAQALLAPVPVTLVQGEV